MSTDKYKTDIPDEVIESLARTLLPSIRAYFESEDGQREFAEWKKKKGNERMAAKAVNLNNMSGRTELGSPAFCFIGCN